MTTIATDGKSMAGDGQVSCGDRVAHSAFLKVVRLADGRIVGVSGTAYDLEPFCDWLMNPTMDKPKLWERSEFLVLHPDGSVLSYNEDCRSIREPTLTASGSGSDFAIGAMMAGASPQRAVEIACAADTKSGGEIYVEHVKAELKNVA